MLNIERALRPRVKFGEDTGRPVELLEFCDLPRGGRVAIPPNDAPGAIAQPGPPLPAGSILLECPAETAQHFRDQIRRELARGKTEIILAAGAVPFLFLCDMVAGGQPTVTEGHGQLGKVLRVPEVERGAMLWILGPQHADVFRQAFNAAREMARRKSMMTNGPNGLVQP